MRKSANVSSPWPFKNFLAVLKLAATALAQARPHSAVARDAVAALS